MEKELTYALSLARDSLYLGGVFQRPEKRGGTQRETVMFQKGSASNDSNSPSWVAWDPQAAAINYPDIFSTESGLETLSQILVQPQESAGDKSA